MYHLVRDHGLRSSLTDEAPAAIAAMIIAEIFYKLGSFTLECVAFLATWCVFSWILGLFRRSRRQPVTTDTGAGQP